MKSNRWINLQSNILLNECNGGNTKLLGEGIFSADERQMLEFFENLPATTSVSTTSSATTASSTQSSTIIPRTCAKTRLVPDQQWSIASFEVMENGITDCQFDRARNCLLKYVYGDKWNITTRNCSETESQTTIEEVLTTTILPESTIITTVMPEQNITEQSLREQGTTYVIAENNKVIETTTLPQTTYTIFPILMANASSNIDGYVIQILLFTYAIRLSKIDRRK